MNVETTKTSNVSWPTVVGTLVLVGALVLSAVGAVTASWILIALAGVYVLGAIGLLILGWRD